MPLVRIEGDDGRTLLDASIVSREPNGVTIKTNAQEGGTLVLAETNYPGWTVKVDGKTADITTVHDMFRGVRILPGAHEVVFRYWPFTGDTLRAIVGSIGK